MPARWWKRPSPPGFRAARRTSSTTPPRPESSRVWRLGRGMRFSSRVPAASRWSGRWKGSWLNSHALLSTLRTAPTILQPAPRLPLHHLPNGFCKPYGVVPVYCAGALAHRQAAAIPDRAVHSRGRPEISSEEGRHAHHGRRSHHHLDCDSNPVVGGPSISVRVDRHRRANRLRLDRVSGRLRESDAPSKPGADGAAQADVPVHYGVRIRRESPGDAPARRLFDRHEHPVLQTVPTVAVDQVA